MEVADFTLCDKQLYVNLDILWGGGYSVPSYKIIGGPDLPVPTSMSYDKGYGQNIASNLDRNCLTL